MAASVPTSGPPEPASPGKCRKHWYQDAVSRCPDCGESFCSECLALPLRDGDVRRCVDCALVVAGVRHRPKRRRRVRRPRARSTR